MTMTSTTFDFGMPSGAPGRSRRKSGTSFAKMFFERVAAFFAHDHTKQESEIATFIEHRGGVRWCGRLAARNGQPADYRIRPET